MRYKRYQCVFTVYNVQSKDYSNTDTNLYVYMKAIFCLVFTKYGGFDLEIVLQNFIHVQNGRM